MQNSQQASVSAEQIDDRLGRARELVERCNKRARADSFNLIQGYIKGNFEIYAGVGVEDSYYSAVLRANGDAVFPVRSEVAVSRELKAVPGSDSNQFTVFVFQIEPMEGIEMIVPSFVRFERRNDIGIGWTKFTEPFPNALVGQTVGLVDDGKMNVVCGLGPIMFCERDHQQVEAAANGVYDDSGFDLNVLGDRLIDGGQDHSAPTLWIGLFPRSASVLLRECPQLGLEYFDLRYRPI